MNSWGSKGPPDEAYERVSDPERFRGLHRAGRDLLTKLETTYLVRREGFLDHARPGPPEPADGLVPSVPGASCLALTFTRTPGLVVSQGRDGRAHIPMCACDACGETLDSCLEQLARIVDTVVAGSFGETLTLAGGAWTHRGWSVDPAGRSEWSRPVDDDHAEELLDRMPEGELTWQPWTRRRPST